MQFKLLNSKIPARVICTYVFKRSNKNKNVKINLNISCSSTKLVFSIQDELFSQSTKTKMLNKFIVKHTGRAVVLLKYRALTCYPLL